MAGMVGSSGSGVFRAAISQSPVTDWLYYGRVECMCVCVCLGVCVCVDIGFQKFHYIHSQLWTYITLLVERNTDYVTLLVEGNTDT